MIETQPVIGLPWISVLAFLRITTHPAPATCQSFGLAAAIVDDWLALPNIRVIGPGANHWPILKRTAGEAQARGGAGDRRRSRRACHRDRRDPVFP